MTKYFAPSPFPTARKPRLPASLLLPRPRIRSEPCRSERVAHLGLQIQALRMAAGRSGGELSLSAGVSRSMLSRVENGLVSPSIDVLERLSRALGVSISRFFSDQPDRTDLCFVPAGQGIVVERLGAVSGFRYELLGHVLSGNLVVEPYLVQVEADAPPYASFQHPGLKFLHMLAGRVGYRYAGMQQDIGPGDSLLFDASALHGVEVIHHGPASYLSVVFGLRG